MPIYISGTNGISGVDGSAGTPAVQGTDTNTGVFYPAADTVALSTNGSERMRVDSSGNVGIGTSSPAFKLELVGGTNNGIHLKDAASATVYGGLFTQSTNLALVTRSNHALTFGTNDTERMRIDSSGNLLVGTTSSGGRFTVKSAGNTSATNTLSITNSSGTTLFYIRDDGAFQTGSASASPYNLTTGSAANVYVDNTGFLYRSTSSLKYKKNVHDATHGLADLLKLRSVTYEGKAEADVGKTFGGLIAEEVDAAGLTEFVQYAEDGTPDALAYGNMVSLCIKAIQEQQAIITALTNRIEALENK